jgi:hypothetical protein
VVRGEGEVVGIEVHGLEQVLHRLVDASNSGQGVQVGKRGRLRDVILPFDLERVVGSHS